MVDRKRNNLGGCPLGPFPDQAGSSNLPVSEAVAIPTGVDWARAAVFGAIWLAGQGVELRGKPRPRVGVPGNCAPGGDYRR